MYVAVAYDYFYTPSRDLGHYNYAPVLSTTHPATASTHREYQTSDAPIRSRSRRDHRAKQSSPATAWPRFRSTKTAPAPASRILGKIQQEAQ